MRPRGTRPWGAPQGDARASVARGWMQGLVIGAWPVFYRVLVGIEREVGEPLARIACNLVDDESVHNVGGKVQGFGGTAQPLNGARVKAKGDYRGFCHIGYGDCGVNAKRLAHSWGIARAGG